MTYQIKRNSLRGITIRVLDVIIDGFVKLGAKNNRIKKEIVWI